MAARSTVLGRIPSGKRCANSTRKQTRAGYIKLTVPCSLITLLAIIGTMILHDTIHLAAQLSTPLQDDLPHTTTTSTTTTTTPSSSSSSSTNQTWNLGRYFIFKPSLYYTQQTQDDSPKRYRPIFCDHLLSHNKTQDIHYRYHYSTHRTRTRTNPPFWISIHDQRVDPIRWSIATNREYYETGITTLFQHILRYHSPRHAFVLDIGANIGWFSLWSAALGNPVFAFEPNDWNWFRLCESVQWNGWNTDVLDRHPRIVIYPYGVGDNEDQSLELAWWQNPGQASFLTKHRNAEYSTKVSWSIRLDDFAIDQGWIDADGNHRSTSWFSTAIGLLKVDVEGYEPQVLFGATRLIQSGIVKNILMEYSVTRYQEDSARRMIELLMSSGYRLQEVSGWKGNANPEMLSYILGGTATFRSHQNTSMHTKNIIANLWNWRKKFPSKGDKSLNLWWKRR